MQARFYLPMYGRFASPDPARDQHFEETQSWNIYSYVRNNPVMNTDPTGMWSSGLIFGKHFWSLDVHAKLIRKALAGRYTDQQIRMVQESNWRHDLKEQDRPELHATLSDNPSDNMSKLPNAKASANEHYEYHVNQAAIAGARGDEAEKFKMMGIAQHGPSDEPTKSHSWTVWNKPTKDVVSMVKAVIHVFWDFMSGGKRGEQAVENNRKVADDVEARQKAIQDQERRKAEMSR